MHGETMKFIFAVYQLRLFVRPVDIIFLPEIILIHFSFGIVLQAQTCEKKIYFLSPSVSMTPVDTSVECTKTEIWGSTTGLLCCSFIFAYSSHLNP